MPMCDNARPFCFLLRFVFAFDHIISVPFLLSRIFLNAAVTTSGENLGRYEVETIGVGEYPFVISFLNMLTQICALTGKSNQCHSMFMRILNNSI